MPSDGNNHFDESVANPHLRAFKEGMNTSRLFRRQVIINQLPEPQESKQRKGTQLSVLGGEILSVVKLRQREKNIGRIIGIFRYYIAKLMTTLE
jgi:hypothetical protein